MRPLVPAVLAQRFADDVRRLIAPRVLALAVSGGADSMAMLALAHAAFPDHVRAATVDHGLRSGATAEAAMVADVCASLDVPHMILAPERPIGDANVQAEARHVRYVLLEDWAAAVGADALLTAHHLDDQAETFLMRAARGSGLPGLTGIRSVRPGGVPIVRPLLSWRRAELRAVVDAAGIAFVEDPSNRDPRFDRVRARALLDATALDPLALARSAGALVEAEAALAMLAERAWDERADATPSQVLIDVAGLPRDLIRRLIRRAIGELRVGAGIAEPAWRDDANVEPLLDRLSAGRSATRAGVLVIADGTTWRCVRAPPRRSH